MIPAEQGFDVLATGMLARFPPEHPVCGFAIGYHKREDLYEVVAWSGIAERSYVVTKEIFFDSVAPTQIGEMVAEDLELSLRADRMPV